MQKVTEQSLTATDEVEVKALKIADARINELEMLKQQVAQLIEVNNQRAEIDSQLRIENARRKQKEIILSEEHTRMYFTTICSELTAITIGVKAAVSKFVVTAPTTGQKAASTCASIVNIATMGIAGNIINFFEAGINYYLGRKQGTAIARLSSSLTTFDDIDFIIDGIARKLTLRYHEQVLNTKRAEDAKRFAEGGVAIMMHYIWEFTKTASNFNDQLPSLTDALVDAVGKPNSILLNKLPIEIKDVLSKLLGTRVLIKSCEKNFIPQELYSLCGLRVLPKQNISSSDPLANTNLYYALPNSEYHKELGFRTGSEDNAIKKLGMIKLSGREGNVHEAPILYLDVFVKDASLVSKIPKDETMKQLEQDMRALQEKVFILEQKNEKMEIEILTIKENLRNQTSQATLMTRSKGAIFSPISIAASDNEMNPTAEQSIASVSDENQPLLKRRESSSNCCVIL